MGCGTWGVDYGACDAACDGGRHAGVNGCCTLAPFAGISAAASVDSVALAASAPFNKGLARGGV